MKVSVVIPAYNEESCIENCLKSLHCQTVKADEIILVDNNCTDLTCRIAQKFPVKIVTEKKQGMIWARNRGFDEAQFDIVARCDADVILPSDWIKKIKENFSRFSIDALTGKITYYDLPLSPPFLAELYLNVMRLYQGGRETLIGPNMAITKNIWKKIRSEVCLDDNQVHEDVDLAIHILKHQGKIKRDKSLIVQSSGRRIKKEPFSFFFEYPARLIKTVTLHGKY